MAYIGQIKVGDYITNESSYENLDSTFEDGPLKVIRIQEVNLGYAGFAFVFVRQGGREMGFYICAVKKYIKSNESQRKTTTD